MHLVHSLLRCRLVLEADEREALPDTSLAVPPDVNPRDAAKCAEEVPQVVLLGIFGDIGDAQRGQVVARAARAPHRLAWPAVAHGWWDVFARATCRGRGSCCARRSGGVAVVIVGHRGCF